MRGIKAPKKPRVQRPLMDDRQDDGWCFVIPPTAATLAGFRAWTGSDDFPEHGHITFVGGEIIIDMSAERLGSHNAVRGAVSRVVSAVADDADLGTYYWEGARLVHMAADISNEPDGMLVRWESFASGAIRDVPSKDGEDFVELEGTPDWILEIVSPSSVHKDTVELRDRYHRARIREYWLIDVRGK